MCVCVCVFGGQEGEEWEEKSAGMQPDPLGYAPPSSPFSVAHCSPNDTSLLLYNRMIPALVTKGRRERKTQTDAHNMHVHACPVRKGVGGIVGRMGDVGRCPVRDYITSLLLSTSIQGNLVEPQLCHRFPFLLLAPLRRQLHIILGIQPG